MDVSQADAPRSVFLSYARRDDDEFVARLYAYLVSQGFLVWWDRQDMPNRALTFTEEIRNAVHHAGRLVVVIGSRALTSDYVRAEWQMALSENKPVVPVVRRVPEGTTDPYTVLPSELRDFHAANFVPGSAGEPPLEPLATLLREPVPPPVPVFGNVPELPPHFRPRPNEFARLFQSVLGELTSTRVLTGSERVTVLSGMGGIGKTVLAASIVHAMRRRPSTFLGDGIYWLNRAPLPQLARLAAAVPGDLLDEDTIVAALVPHFAGKRFMLVVDNATSADQIAPLVRILGPSGRMLVTTRHGELATGRPAVHLDRLTESEALLLIADWLGADPKDLPADVQRVAKLCGFHPFALAVNAAAASNGLSWSSIAEALELRELGYTRHRFDEYIYDSVEQSIRISLDALDATFPDAARRYRDLAAFLWDAGVPASAIATFWQQRSGMAPRHAERLLAFFRQRSLVDLRGDDRSATVLLHDLHRAFIESDEAEVRVLNEGLLAAYQPPGGNDWWNVPDDGYLHDHLMLHLDRTRSKEEIVAFLRSESRPGLNAWYQTRLATGGFAGYLADVQVAARGSSHYLPALIASSLISLAKAVPGDLLSAAVRQGRWPLERAMAYARIAAPDVKRAAAMISLVPLVHERSPWLEDVLDALDRIEIRARAPLVERLATVATDAELMMILRHVTRWHLGAHSPYEHTQSVPSINGVLARVQPAFAVEALRIVEGTSLKPLRLYTFLPEPERSQQIDRVLERAREERGEMATASFAITVSGLAQQMGREPVAALLSEAFVDVRQLERGSVLRRESLFDLLPYLGATEQEAAFEELLADARSRQPRLFARLAKAAPPSFHARIARELEEQQLAWITDGAPELAPENREALVDRALAEIEQQENATSLLWLDDAKLIAGMTDRQLERAAAIAEARLDGPQRIQVLSATAFAASPAQRDAAVIRALTSIDELNDTDHRAAALQRLAPLLSGRYLDEALSGAQRIGEPSGRDHLPKMLAYAQTAPATDNTQSTNSDVIPSDLPVEEVCAYLADLIEPVDMVEHLRMRRRLPTRHFPHPKNERRGGVAAALVRRLCDLRASERAFDVLRNGRNDAVTLTAFVELAPALSDEHVIDVERRIEQADFGGEFWIQEGVGVTGVSDEYARAYLRARLAPALARTGAADRALAYVRSVDLERQPQAWIGIAGAASGPARDAALLEALTATLSLPDYHRRDHLDQLGVALGAEPSLALRAWQTGIEWARTHPRHEAIEVLASLAPAAAAVGGDAFVVEVHDAIERVLAWWP